MSLNDEERRTLVRVATDEIAMSVLTARIGI